MSLDDYQLDNSNGSNWLESTNQLLNGDFGINLDNSEQRINRLIFKSCRTYFSKTKL